MMMRRYVTGSKRWLFAVTILLTCAAVAFAAGAREPEAVDVDTWPTRTINAVVPYSAGGAADIATRNVAAVIRNYLGVEMSIENRPGAGGAIGAAWVLGQPANGYTALFASAGAGGWNTIAPREPETPYEREDFLPVGIIAQNTAVVAVRGDGPWQSVEELVADARANPGDLTFGAQSLTGFHLLQEHFVRNAAQIQTEMIPYSGGADIMAALAGGHVDFTFQLASEARPFIGPGDVRILATLSTDRPEDFPDIPTMTELGYKEIVRAQWVGAYVPATTPPEIVQKFADALEQVARNPDYRRRAEAAGYLPVFIPGEQVREIEAFYENMYAELSKIVAGE